MYQFLSRYDEDQVPPISDAPVYAGGNVPIQPLPVPPQADQYLLSQSGGPPQEIVVTPEQIAAAQAAVAQEQASPEAMVPSPPEEEDLPVYGAPQRKGLFGIKGTARDIVGLLGDAFLVQSGNKPIYSPKVREEREAQALAGMMDGENGYDTAIDNMSRVNPASALEMYKDRLKQRMELQRMAEAKEEHRLKQAAAAYKIHGNVMNYLRTADEGSYPHVRAQALKYYEQNGITPPFDLPEVYSKQAIDALSRSAVDVGDQEKIDNTESFRETRLGQYSQAEQRQQRNVDSQIQTRDANVGIASARVAETRRTNRVREGQGAERISIARERVKGSGGSKTSVPPNPPTRAGQPARNSQTGDRFVGVKAGNGFIWKKIK